MEGKTEISLDKLPIKRLESIEENGLERFPSDVGYEEKRLSQIRRIDFAWAVKKDASKKQKTCSSKETSTESWPWKTMVENLQLAHQELSVIIDLINTVEANDAVTVAGMTKPKQLPNELLSDLSVSAATKLQCFRHVGKYFKQSAKALEQQVTRDARFYGALIRLQQNWKVKRQRTAAPAPGSEGFSIDLFDNSLYDHAAVLRPSSISTVRVDRDSAGMLAIHLPTNSCHSLHFEISGAHSGRNPNGSEKIKSYSSNDNPSTESRKEALTDDEVVKQTHLVLRKVHQTIFNEQVFDLVNREAFNPSLGVTVIGVRENHLQFSLGLGASVIMALVPSRQDDQTADIESVLNSETADLPLDTIDGAKLAEGKHDSSIKQKLGFPNHITYEIYLRQLFHENISVKAKDRPASSGRTQLPNQSSTDKAGLLGHFCMSLAHRIFSRKVLVELEKLVSRVPYLHLISHPTWHSRTSSWTLFMKVPQSILHAGRQAQAPNDRMNNSKSHFRTKVVVNDDSIIVEGEGAPNTIGLFRGSSEEIHFMNRYDCNLIDLPIILLQQFASQVIRWLHEEALMVGIKANRNFLCLSFELDQGETLSLVAHVDPDDSQGCISWWLVMEDGFTRHDILNGGSEYRKYLGHLSLDVLYSTLMDLVSLCNGSGKC